MEARHNSTRIRLGPSRSRALGLSIAAIFAALTCVATLIITLGIPATGGYFNVGEFVVYVAALLFGPYVAGFAGGVGAAIADMLVAPQFAPGTLIVKGLEGIIVGSLNRVFRRTSKFNWRIFTAFMGVVVGLLLTVIGSLYYNKVELVIGLPQLLIVDLNFSIPAYAWYLIGTAVSLFFILMGLRVGPESGRASLSIVIGGLEMVLGYYLYELLVLGKTLAIVEIAANLVQMIIGLIVAIPIARTIQRRLPQLKN
jgi:uncharacterized membrane protein